MMSDRDQAETDSASFAGESRPEAGRPPVVWPAFAAMAAVFLATLLASAVGLGIMMTNVAPDPEGRPDVAEVLESFPGIMVVLGLVQGAFLVTAIAAAALHASNVRRRLGLVRGSATTTDVLFFIGGSFFILGIGLLLASPLILLYTPDDSIAVLRASMSWEEGLAFALLIGLAPGICEEVFFRGFIQPVFIARWGTCIGVVATALVFALFHIDPMHVVLAFPMGIWVGFIAARTGSVVPGMLCHASVNGIFNLAMISATKAGVLEAPSFAIASWVILAVSAVPFIWAIRRLRRLTPCPGELPTPRSVLVEAPGRWREESRPQGGR